MTCPDCRALPPFTSSYSMHCAACVRRWLLRKPAAERRFVIEAMKGRFTK